MDHCVCHLNPRGYHGVALCPRPCRITSVSYPAVCNGHTLPGQQTARDIPSRPNSTNAPQSLLQALLENPRSSCVTGQSTLGPVPDPVSVPRHFCHLSQKTRGGMQGRLENAWYIDADDAPQD